MDNLRSRTRLAVLWGSFAILGAVWMGLALWFPGLSEQILAGQYGGEQITDGFLMLIFIPFTLIPLIMAVLCLNLNDKANRWTNIVVGILFLVFNIIGLFEPGDGEPPVTTTTLDIASIVVPALIVWFAWKSHKQQA